MVRCHISAVSPRPHSSDVDEPIPLTLEHDRYYSAISKSKFFAAPNVILTGGSRIPCPKYILIPNIFSNNHFTEDIFETKHQMAGKFWDPDWPGLKFEMTTDAGKAALATPHGRAVVFFLVQHKDILGMNEIKSVSIVGEIYHGIVDDEISALFEIGAVMDEI
jgi:hypothetical protein